MIRNNLQNDLGAVMAEARRGRHKATLKLAKSGMKRHPKHPAFPELAGVALCAIGREREAVAHYKRALQIDPSLINIRRNLALALIVLKEFEQAARHLTKVVEIAPDDSGAWHYLAVSHLEIGENEEGLKASDRANELSPDNVEMLETRTELKKRLGRNRSALEDCNHALTLDPNRALLWNKLSKLHSAGGNVPAALKAAERANELVPEQLDTLNILTREQSAGGKMEEAIANAHRALELYPHETLLIELLSRLHGAEQNAEFQSYAESEFKKAKRGTNNRARIGFACSYIAKSLKDAEKEAKYLKMSNDMLARLFPYETDRETERNKVLLSLFSKPIVSFQGSVPTTPSPIYVVGLPRSGTTLTEAVIGAHPQVNAMGERHVTSMFFNVLDGKREFDQELVESFKEIDADDRYEKSAELPFYVDKMPANFRFIGLIKAIYPDARFVNLVRDPRDVALSMWRANFGEGNIPYTYDQKAMAHYFNIYRQTIRHWHTLFPGEILDLPYSDLTADPVGMSQKIADHCRLEWAPEMARPDLHAGEVRTFSIHQLRQPVHQRSVGGWRKCADMLSEVISGLNPELWPEIVQDP